MIAKQQHSGSISIALYVEHLPAHQGPLLVEDGGDLGSEDGIHWRSQRYCMSRTVRGVGRLWDTHASFPKVSWTSFQHICSFQAVPLCVIPLALMGGRSLLSSARCACLPE